MPGVRRVLARSWGISPNPRGKNRERTRQPGTSGRFVGRCDPLSLSLALRAAQDALIRGARARIPAHGYREFLLWVDGCAREAGGADGAEGAERNSVAGARAGAGEGIEEPEYERWGRLAGPGVYRGTSAGALLVGAWYRGTSGRAIGKPGASSCLAGSARGNIQGEVRCKASFSAGCLFKFSAKRCEVLGTSERWLIASGRLCVSGTVIVVVVLPLASFRPIMIKELRGDLSL